MNRDRYLLALALAHMLCESYSKDEDALADALNRGVSDGRWTEKDLESAQSWACGNGPHTIRREA